MKIILSIAMLISLCYGGMIDDGIKEFNNGNYSKAFPIFKKLANKGDTSGHYNLGLMYEIL